MTASCDRHTLRRRSLDLFLLFSFSSSFSRCSWAAASARSLLLRICLAACAMILLHLLLLLLLPSCCPRFSSLCHSRPRLWRRHVCARREQDDGDGDEATSSFRDTRERVVLMLLHPLPQHLLSRSVLSPLLSSPLSHSLISHPFLSLFIYLSCHSLSSSSPLSVLLSLSLSISSPPCHHGDV